MKFPVDFEEKSANSDGHYPTQISARHLMANFAYAALDARAAVNGVPQPFSTTEEQTSEAKSHRLLTFNPPPPLDGATYVLAFAGGRYQWLRTEEC